MPELAKLVRDKYPSDYDDLTDQELERLVLAKYPEYKDLASKPEKSTARKVYDKLSEPLTNAPSRFASSVADYIDPSNPESTRMPGGRLRGFAAGALKGAGDVVSSLTSPLNLALTASGIGEAKTGARGFQLATKALSAPVVAHGASETFGKDKSLAERGFGVAEMAAGASGFAHYPSLRREVSPVEDVKVPEKSIKSTTKDTEPTAEFHSWQQDINGKGKDFPIYTIKGGELDGSTVAKSSLAKMGIKTPKTPINPFAKEAEVAKIKRFNELASAKGDESLPVRPPREMPIEGNPQLDELMNQLHGEDTVLPGNGTFDKVVEEKKPFVNPFEKSTKPPDLTPEGLPEEPQFARNEQGKLAIGADIKSLSKVLGTSLYKGDIATIATKELLQNSVDSVRHLGEAGNIEVLINHGDHYIQVADNGKGMTKSELETVFTDLGASGKRGESEAVGGFGLAKAAPLLGGESVEVTSIARDPKTGKLVRNSFSGTPEELVAGVDIKSEVVPEGTVTGTTVKVKVPKDSSFYGAARFARDMSKGSHGMQTNVKLAEQYSRGIVAYPKHFDLLPKSSGKILATLKSPSAETQLIVPDSATTGTRTSMNLHLANNGMFQGKKPIYFNDEIPNIPSDITVNIKSKVPEGHADYPFTANREELRGTVEGQVQKYIDENLVNPSLKHRASELQRLYDGMLEINVGKGEFPDTFGYKISLYDPKGQITPEEMHQITSNPTFHAISGDIASTINDTLKILGNQSWKDRLEKTGIIFSDDVHGIHIPNPATKRSAILVNPFLAMRDLDPDGAAASILHTILHETAHIEPMASGHNEAFTIRLADIYSKFGARRSVGAQDRILKSITDNTGNYSGEVQELLQRYQASRGNPATTEDLLSGTGIKSTAKGGGEGGVSKGRRPNGEGTPVQSALKKLANAVVGSKGLREEQEAIYKSERGKRFAAFRGVKDTGESGAGKQLSALKGGLTKLNIEDLQLSQPERDSLFDAIRSANITDGEKATGYQALFKLLSGGHVPQRGELHVLDTVFGKGMGMQGGPGAASEYDILSSILSETTDVAPGEAKLLKPPSKGRQVYELTRGLMSVDIPYMTSAAFRQGVGLAGTRRWFGAVVDQARAFGNKKVYDTIMGDIERNSIHLRKMMWNSKRQRTEYTTIADQIGLKSSNLKSLYKREEQIRSTLQEKIPIAGAYIRASNRSYTAFLNSLRTHTAEDWIKAAGLIDSHGNITNLADARRIGNTINELTGAASLDIDMPFSRFTGSTKRLQLSKATDVLGTIFFSPKNMMRDARMMNPLNYIKNDKLARQEYLKGAIRRAAVWAGFTGAAAIGLDATVGTNPTSSDFGKVKIGDTRADAGSGLLQWIVLMSRQSTGETTSSTSNKTRELGSSPVSPTRGELLVDFLVNRLHPTLQPVANALLASKKRPFHPLSQAIEHVIPMYMSDFHDIMNNDPELRQIILGLAAGSLSMGSTTYGKADFGKPQFEISGDIKFEGGAFSGDSVKKPRRLSLSH